MQEGIDTRELVQVPKPKIQVEDNELALELSELSVTSISLDSKTGGEGISSLTIGISGKCKIVRCKIHQKGRFKN